LIRSDQDQRAFVEVWWQRLDGKSGRCHGPASRRTFVHWGGGIFQLQLWVFTCDPALG